MRAKKITYIILQFTNMYLLRINQISIGSGTVNNTNKINGAKKYFKKKLQWTVYIISTFRKKIHNINFMQIQ